jgi:hypothetical protein
MIATSKPTQVESTAQNSARHEMGWLLAMAAAFLVVHIAASVICMRASANETAPAERLASRTEAAASHVGTALREERRTPI